MRGFNDISRKSIFILVLVYIFLIRAIPSIYADAGPINDAGATRVGMYAAIAKVTDATAIFHNVANIATKKGTEIYFSTLVCYPEIAFKVASIDQETGEITYSPAVKPNFNYAAFPYFGLISDLGLTGWRFGIANFLPNLAGGSFDENSALRYHLVKGFFFTDYTSFAAARRINDKVYLGASLDLIYAFQHGYRMVNLYQQVPPPDNEIFRDLSDLKLFAELDDYAFGYHFSALYIPSDRVQMGISYFERSDLILSGDMTLKTTHNETIPVLGIQKFTTKTEITMLIPRTIKLGFNFKINMKWNWGFDLYWWDFSKWKYQKQRFPGIEDDPVGRMMAEFLGTEMKIPKNYDDGYQIAGGAEYQVNSKWKARFGVQYDDSPIPDETFSLDNFTSDLIGGTAGFEYQVGANSTFAMGIQHVFMYRRYIKSSLTIPPSTGKVVTSDVDFVIFEWNYRL